MEYTSAELKIIYGPLADRTKRIQEQAVIQRLLSFFPGAGGNREGSEPAAPWENAVVIQFTKADGTATTVATNCDFWSEVRHEASEHWFWSEGQGDWLLGDADGFRTYMRELFKEGNT